MNDAYIQGFIARCAELGVDPSVLTKQAARGSQLIRTVLQLANNSAAHDSAVSQGALIRLLKQLIPARGAVNNSLVSQARTGRFINQTLAKTRGLPHLNLPSSELVNTLNQNIRSIRPFSI